MNIDQTIFKFNKIFFEKIEKDKILDISDYTIAGGAIRDTLAGDKIKDIDIFCSSEEAVKKLEMWFFMQNGVKVLEGNELLSNYSLNGNWFQIIKTTFFPKHNPTELIKNFDFTICGVMMYKGEIHTLDTFYQDLLAKQLRANTFLFPLSSLERMQKYIKKGYTACNGTLLELAQDIQKLDLNKPGDNRLEFYPDGTPRFLGVD